MDPEFSKLNYENFLKQYWISVKFSRILHPERKKLENFLNIRYLSASDFPTFRHYLREEKKQLDKYIEYVETKENSEFSSEIDEEIQKLEKKLNQQQKSTFSCLERFFI